MAGLRASFPNALSSSQNVVVCYRGPGCSTYDEFVDPDGPTAPNLSVARNQAGTDFLNECQQFLVDDVTNTPFGDLTLDGVGTSGIVHICTGILDREYVRCDEDSVWLIQMEGPEGSLRVEVDIFELILVRAYCMDSVQVLSGDCTWYGYSVECTGTEATIMVVPSARFCCGNLDDPIQTECASLDSFDESICRNEGPPIGFETDPTCDVFDQLNANLPRAAFDTDQLRNPSCDSYQTGSPPGTVTTEAPTQSPTPAPVVVVDPTQSPTLIPTPVLTAVPTTSTVPPTTPSPGTATTEAPTQSPTPAPMVVVDPTQIPSTNPESSTRPPPTVSSSSRRLSSLLVSGLVVSYCIFLL